MASKAAPPGNAHIAWAIRSCREHESERRQLVQVSEIIGKGLNGEARLGDLGRGVASDEVHCPPLQFGRVDLLPNSGFEMRHLAVVGQVRLPIPDKAEEQEANRHWNELTHSATNGPGQQTGAPGPRHDIGTSSPGLLPRVVTWDVHLLWLQ